MLEIPRLLALTSAAASANAYISGLDNAMLQQHILANPPTHEQSTYDFPSVHESAVMARRILHLTTIGTLVTSFPASTSSQGIPLPIEDNDKETLHTLENRPTGVENSPIGLMEYFADCEPYTGNPTILALNIATPFRNYNAGSNISLSLRWWPEQTSSYLDSYFGSLFETNDDEELPTPRTPAALPRFSLHGYLEPIPQKDLEENRIAKCFVHAHPDSKWWQPGNQIHEAQYMRLIVEHVYWLGGFGDRARIQWLHVEEWRNVSMEEVAACRLPGEKKKGRRYHGHGHGRGWLGRWNMGL